MLPVIMHSGFPWAGKTTRPHPILRIHEGQLTDERFRRRPSGWMNRSEPLPRGPMAPALANR